MRELNFKIDKSVYLIAELGLLPIHAGLNLPGCVILYLR